MEKLPTDLKKALTASPRAMTAWKDLTPIAQRDFTRWVESAKQPTTRARRITRTTEMLLEGKRRPCCYAVVPMNLYRALGANTKAKAHWKNLTPDERRDIVDQVDKAPNEDACARKIQKIIATLAAGKRV